MHMADKNGDRSLVSHSLVAVGAVGEGGGVESHCILGTANERRNVLILGACSRRRRSVFRSHN